jgi:hypothetical protein
MGDTSYVPADLIQSAIIALPDSSVVQKTDSVSYPIIWPSANDSIFHFSMESLQHPAWASSFRHPGVS